MNTHPAPADVERFRDVVARRLGLRFEESRLGFLAEVLGRRVDSGGRFDESYLSRIEAPDAPDAEIRALAEELTVSETYFFRHDDQFRAFAEIALEDRLRARRDGRRLRILSAGCASGEEAYSLAVFVRERVSEPAREVAIRAVDVNPALLRKAARGLYSEWSVRETPEHLRRRWFRQEGRDLLLDDAVRAMVTFEERNLAAEDADLWEPGAYDVVFCRNVMMYFTPESARRLVERLARAIAPGGYLFLGHAETLRGLSQDFHLRHTHGSFYYQRKEAAEGGRREPASWDAAPGAPAAGPPAGSGPAGTPASGPAWMDEIHRAAGRIQSLAEAPARARESGTRAPAGPDPRRRWTFDLAVDLLRRERFDDALERLREAPPESARDPDVLLLRAALLTLSGQLDAAERACRDLLEVDELSAGGHYLLALCREGLGDIPGAVEHDQAAAYLDPQFAMPRLHLGLLARKGGGRDAARRDLEEAMLLLQREDASRLLLFGGGFGREALVRLCLAELAAQGGSR